MPVRGGGGGGAAYTDAQARAAAVSDAVYGAGWDGVTDVAPSKNVVYDKIETLSGGMSQDFSIWLPDAPPASPGADDDEFADASGGVPGGWTEVDFDGRLTVQELEAGLVFDHTSGGFSWAGIYKTIPAGDFTIWCPVSISGSSQYTRAALALWEDPTDNAKGVYVLSLLSVALGGTLGRTQKWDTYNSFNSDLGNFDPARGKVYLRIQRTATTYRFSFSQDGLGWGQILSTALAFVPTKYGPAMSNDAGITGRAVFGPFRYVASDVGLTGIMNGDRIGGHRN